ncbi:hypothetical protein NHX12_005925 [Muraenolepis orangiensis]|uniref:Aminopeptidase n=1 Tax=Muraenolepis orangiensis TaxID=630683 RepID=A0A9Q0IE54_9TELE|nr:hypothetical protein NHX12_005925 [Muraenolepis orangiensis]
MSTYLLGFIVSNFTFIQAAQDTDVQVRIWARRQAIAEGQGDYALNVTGAILNFYEGYYNTSYPLSKSDQVALPDFNAGAMENWGLITYRETALLYDPATSSVGNKERVTTVISHELAHMWFGNLVTLRWWNDLWLNEGFASYVEYLGADHAEPSWEIRDHFVLLDVHKVFAVDALASSHPLSRSEDEVNEPTQITEMFNTISYSKGAAVLRMLSDFLSESVFARGLSSYLNTFAFSNTVYTDLWDHLQQAVEDSQNVSLPHSVQDIMNRWVLQMGFPVVTVDTVTGRISQKHFLLDPEAEVTRPSPFNYTWFVPIKWMKSGVKQEQFWLLKETDQHEAALGRHQNYQPRPAGPTQTCWTNPDLLNQPRPAGPTQTCGTNPDLLDQPRPAGPTQTCWTNPDLRDQPRPAGPTQTCWTNPDLLNQPRPAGPTQTHQPDPNRPTQTYQPRPTGPIPVPVLSPERHYLVVNYDPDNWERLLRLLHTDHQAIPIINRAQLLDDAFNLARAKVINTTLALRITGYLSKEKDYIPWESALNNLNYYFLMFDRTEVYGPLQAYIRKQIQPLFEYFRTMTDNWTRVPQSHNDQYNQINALSVACSMGVKGCRELVQSWFSRWMADPEHNLIHPNLKSTVYCSAVAFGGTEEWDFAWRMFQNSTVASESARLRSALACTKAPWLLNRYLQYTLDPTKIRKQDATRTIQAVAKNVVGMPLAWNFVREKWGFLFEQYGRGSFSFAGLINGITKRFSTEFELQELKRFKEQNLKVGFGSATLALEQAIEKTQANIRWVAESKGQVLEWLSRETQ